MIIKNFNGLDENTFFKQTNQYSKSKKMFFSSLVFGSFFLGKKIEKKFIEKKFLGLNKKKYSKIIFLKFLLPFCVEYKTKVFCSLFFKSFCCLFKKNKNDVDTFFDDKSG